MLLLQAREDAANYTDWFSADTAVKVYDTESGRSYYRYNGDSYKLVDMANVFYLDGLPYFLHISERFFNGDKLDSKLYKLEDGVSFFHFGKNSLQVELNNVSFRMKASIKDGILGLSGYRFLVSSCFVMAWVSQAGIFCAQLTGYEVDMHACLESALFRVKDGLYSIGDNVWAPSAGSLMKKMYAKVQLRNCAVSGPLKVSVWKLRERYPSIAYVSHVIEVDRLGCFLITALGRNYYWGSVSFSGEQYKSQRNLFCVMLAKEEANITIFFMMIGGIILKCVLDRRIGIFIAYDFYTNKVHYRNVPMYDKAVLSKELMMTGMIAVP